MLDRRQSPPEQWPTWLERRADVSLDWHDTVMKACRERQHAQHQRREIPAIEDPAIPISATPPHR